MNKHHVFGFSLFGADWLQYTKTTCEEMAFVLWELVPGMTIRSAGKKGNFKACCEENV